MLRVGSHDSISVVGSEGSDDLAVLSRDTHEVGRVAEVHGTVGVSCVPQLPEEADKPWHLARIEDREVESTIRFSDGPEIRAAGSLIDSVSERLDAIDIGGG